MAIQRQINFATIDELTLDPTNPRLGRRNTGRNVPQERVLELMKDWTLDELAVSFMESGFWPQEALICVREELYGAERLVVVEGNRRLAALRYLRDAINGRPATRKWRELVEGVEIPPDLFTRIPYMMADSRTDVDAFLGFRHVTGIKEWHPAEKAEYIAKLIDERNMTYVEVMRIIGSKTDPVRRNYIAYRILRQLEENEEEVSLRHVEDKFSVLYLSLRELGVQKFLGVNVQAEPIQARIPVPADKIPNLVLFINLLFGSDRRDPLFTDSRNVTKFGKILESERAIEYLRMTEHSSFEVALQKAGADEPELIERVVRATDEIEQALGRVHLHVDSRKLQEAVDRFGRGAIELLRKFPNIYEKIFPKKD